MEEKTLKLAAVFLSVLTVVVCIALPQFPKLHMWASEIAEMRLAEQEYAAAQLEMSELEIAEQEEDGGDLGKLRLRLPEGVDGSQIRFANDYVTQTLRIEIPGTDDLYFDKDPITGSSNHIDTLSYTRDGARGIVEIVMDSVYELETAYDAESYYFDFLTPQEVYEKVVVIDAGHGGRVPGATKMGIREKDIDLAIVLELKKLFEEKSPNIGVYCTRTDDSNPTFEQRVQLANKSNANLFLSVHNNSTGNGRMSSASGTAVMYQETDERELGSRYFAQLCAEEVSGQLGSRNRGLIDGNQIYIIRNSEVPAALIEVGFMTNKKELELLNSQEYQQQAALGMYRAILRAFEEGY